MSDDHNPFSLVPLVKSTLALYLFAIALYFTGSVVEQYWPWLLGVVVTGGLVWLAIVVRRATRERW